MPISGLSILDFSIYLNGRDQRACGSSLSNTRSLARAWRQRGEVEASTSRSLPRRSANHRASYQNTSVVSAALMSSSC